MAFYKRPQLSAEEEIARIRMPKEGQIFGVVLSLLGASRLSVECEDGKTRVCKIPGRLRRRIRIRPNDLVLVEPWKIQPDEKGDIIWRYTRTQISWIQKRGILKNITV